MDPRNPGGRHSITSIDKGDGDDVEGVTGDRGGVEEVDGDAPARTIDSPGDSRGGDPPDSLDEDERRNQPP